MRRRLFNLCALVSTLTCLAVMVLAHESRQLFFAIERGFWDEGFFSGFNSNRAHWAAYESAIEIPHWALAVLLAVLPATWCTRVVTARRRSRRIARGLCASCGYDLRSSYDRCPECGATIPLRNEAIVLP